MTVYLVGAGPGDPELLTLRAARLLATADVVVVDRLVDPRVLEMIAPGTHVIDAGKRSGAGDPTRAQARIIEQLLDLGRRHDTVVRLKGGDPFVFGRGAEELDALSDAGIDVEVVPGLTSALAVPALAGVAVTERGIAASVTIVSGHDVDAAVRTVVAAGADATCVLLMAVATRAAIAGGLIDAGRAECAPVAVIERGATREERRIATTLGELGALEVEAPAVLVLGAAAARLEVPAGPVPATRALAGAVRGS